MNFVQYYNNLTKKIFLSKILGFLEIFKYFN